MSNSDSRTALPNSDYIKTLLALFSTGRTVGIDEIVALGSIPMSNGEVINEHQVENILGFLSSGGSLSLLREYTPDELEAIYALARSYVDNGELELGHTLFQYLCLHDHFNPRYWLALGISQVGLSRFDQALSTFAMGTMVGVGMPEFPLQCAEIHLRRGDLEAASSGANMAIAYLNAKPSAGPEMMKCANAILSAIERLEQSRKSDRRAV